jgi:hypothetical protein
MIDAYHALHGRSGFRISRGHAERPISPRLHSREQRAWPTTEAISADAIRRLSTRGARGRRWPP